MLNFVKGWRERGWQEISATDYAAAWNKFGGSVATHPYFVAELSALAEIEVAYLGSFVDSQLQAAVAVWGRDIALSKHGLRRHGKRRLFDLGNPELIFPHSGLHQSVLRHKAEFISCKHADILQGLSDKGIQLALVREPEEYSKKFRYNQRRELRLFQEQGGEIHSFTELDSKQQAQLYSDLFERRWQFETPGKQRLAEVFALLRPYMIGSYLTVDGKPAAAQVLYRVEAPEWISVEYINAGVEPDFNHLSPGSVLTWLNTQEQWDYALALKKDLRYSFGRADRDYKLRWCNPVPVFQAG